MVGTWSRHDRCDCAGSVSYCRQYEALADVAMWRRGYNMRLPDARLHHPAGPGTTTARSCAWWLPRPLVSAYSFRTSTTRGACHSIAGRRSHVRVVTCATCRKYGYVVVVSQQGTIDMSWSFVIWRGSDGQSKVEQCRLSEATVVSAVIMRSKAGVRSGYLLVGIVRCGALGG
jgi:hypothetical protein